MKAILTIAVLMAGSLSLANQGTRSYTITNPQFAGDHLSGTISGKVVINYDDGTVSLNASGAPKCKPNELCSNMVDELIVELPIVDIKKDSCGVTVVTASKDQRPVDGQLQTLTVEDASKMTCPTFATYVEHATYSTSGYNFVTGAEISNTSTMDLELIPEVSRVFSMASAQLLEGFPKSVEAQSGSLKISDKQVSLTVNISPVCKVNQLCAQNIMVLSANLPIVEVKKSQCSTDITARAANFFPFDHKGTKEIVIHDYSDSTCEMVYLHALQVEYYSDMTSNGGQTDNVQRAQFSFDFAPILLTK
jgi:hypothetical protein